jgi:folate-binding protein YgfZ
MTTTERPDLDTEYRQLREECGLTKRNRHVISVSGPDAAEFLQGQVTNDVEALAPGTGCYAVLLDRKGHVQADMRIFCRATGDLLVDTPYSAGSEVLSHLSTYRIGRDVDVTGTDLAVISLIGPASIEVVGSTPGPENSLSDETIAGAECFVASTNLGADVICSSGDMEAVISQLESAGAIPVSTQAAEVLRVETGRPALESEMSAGPMPAEAGIVDRAVSFNKGCYIGQEPVARLHYKGRPNRFLRGLRLDGQVADGDAVRLGERELGTIGTAVLSPASGWVALAILRREAEPGTRVEVLGDQEPVGATVTDLPFIAGDPS